MLAHCSVGNIKKFFKIIFKTSMKWDDDNFSEKYFFYSLRDRNRAFFLRTNWNVILGSAM